jgi:SAM-dependent methyltransferase
MLTQAFQRFCAVVRDEGMGGAIARVAKIFRPGPQRIGADDFDEIYKTETSIIVPLWRLRIPSPNAKFGIRYQTMAPSEFLSVLRKVQEDSRNLVFIDLGCGKGRTLILAAKQGFKRVIGVEFSPELAAIARENVRRAGAAAEVVEMDASHFNLPDDNLLIYMYNPFGDQVVDSVVGNLQRWTTQSNKRAFVIYADPACRMRFDSAAAFEILVDQDGLCVWRLQDRQEQA